MSAASAWRDQTILNSRTARGPAPRHPLEERLRRRAAVRVATALATSTLVTVPCWAYITRVLGGHADFTLKTMSKLALALGLQLEVGLGPQRLPSIAAQVEERDAR